MTRPDPIPMIDDRHAGARGVMRVVRRADIDAPLAEQALRDPDRFVPAPTKPSQERKLTSRRAVHSFPASIDGRPGRLYLKLYRVRTLKDVAEELLFGKRARRALAAGIEAERRGIAVPIHLGASHPAVFDRRPAGSALVTAGVPHHHDARTLLDSTLVDKDRTRRAFLVTLGRFLGDTHRRGLIHGDLKLGNVFRLTEAPLRFCVIDLDRAHFQSPHGKVGVRQALDVRKLLRSSRRTLSGRERRLLLASYFRGRGVARADRRRSTYLDWAWRGAR